MVAMPEKFQQFVKQFTGVIDAHQGDELPLTHGYMRAAFANLCVESI